MAHVMQLSDIENLPWKGGVLPGSTGLLGRAGLAWLPRPKLCPGLLKAKAKAESWGGRVAWSKTHTHTHTRARRTFQHTHTHTHTHTHIPT